MADESEQMGQDEIEALLRQSQDPAGSASNDSVSNDSVSDDSVSDDSVSDDSVSDDSVSDDSVSDDSASDNSAATTDAGGAAPVGVQASLDPSEIEALMQGANSVSADDQASLDPDQALLDQSEIEAMMRAASNAPATASPTAPSPTPPRSAPAAQTAPKNDIDYLLNQAEAALASIDAGAVELPSGVHTFKLENFSGTLPSTEATTLDLMRDVQLDVIIELGRTHMHLEEVLKLGKGAVVSLDKLAGDPVDIFVNGRLIARGEVLVLNDNFCVRVAELIVGESACA